MRAVIVCLIIFIVGYNIGNKRSTPIRTTEGVTDTMKNLLSNETHYQASNYMETDSLLNHKQEELLHQK